MIYSFVTIDIYIDETMVALWYKSLWQLMVWHQAITLYLKGVMTLHDKP